MRLSEAIRLGELAATSAHGKWFQWDAIERKYCGGCAVGRMCIAAGMDVANKARHPIQNIDKFMLTTWPWLEKYRPEYPLTIPPEMINHRYWYEVNTDPFCIQNPLRFMISNLYECCEWSMQQIADWVESIEPKEVPSEAIRSDEVRCDENQAALR